MNSIIEFLSKYINKTLILIVLCMFLGAGALYHISNLVVTEEVLAREIKDVQDQIQSNDKAVSEKILIMRQGMLEQQVWDLDARVDDTYDPDKKAKWIRRLKRTEKKLEVVEEQIQELEKK